MYILKKFCRATRHAPRATLCLLFLILPPLAFAAEGTFPGSDAAGGLKGEHVFIVNDYRYDPAGSGSDPDTGHAFCASRCNALSVDYRNYIDPGGWRFMRIAENRDVTVPTDNPFLGGTCICTADEYLVQINEFNRPKR